MRRSTQIMVKTLILGLSELAEDSPDPILGTIGEVARVVRRHSAGLAVARASSASMFGLDEWTEEPAATEAPSGVCARCGSAVLRSWHFCPACGGDTFIERADDDRDGVS